MNRVLLVGIKPAAVDTTDPDIPPGTTQEGIAAGIETALADMRGRGWTAEFCSILPDTGDARALAPLGPERRKEPAPGARQGPVPEGWTGPGAALAAHTQIT